MTAASEAFPHDVVMLTTEVTSAYLAHNAVQISALPGLIASVHRALTALSAPSAAEPEKPTPAVPIKKSVTPDYIVCLEDGRRFKSLKRHLTGLGMSPAEYRAKWGLPNDYPMVAANYAQRRSELAKAAGLGQQRRKSRKSGSKPKARHDKAA
jgi:predicted transcriptional regulator